MVTDSNLWRRNLRVGLLTCFDLIYILSDKPDRLRDRVIAEKVLEITDIPQELPVDHILLCAYFKREFRADNRA